MSDRHHFKKSKSTQQPTYYSPAPHHGRVLSVLAPTITRKLTKADKVLLKTHTWSNLSDFKLEDHVVVADARQGALQGLVAYVGEVHFGRGLWVGIQLSGPSLGKGYNDGAHQGQRYFQSVGKRNGVFAHVSGIQHRHSGSSDTITDAQDPEAQFAQMKCIESLRADRERRILLKESNEKKKATSMMMPKDDAIYIKRLKQQSLEELRMSRSEPLEGELLALEGPKPKYAKDESTKFCEADFLFMRGLQDSKQSFVLTDPTLPDNPITFASHAFLTMTQYTLNHVLGRNCRFLQGNATSRRSVAKIRLAIDEGSDCSIRIINYKRDGTPFWNEFFCTALRDTRGRIKSHVGVLVEISDQVNAIKNEVAAKLDSSYSATTRSPIREQARSTSEGDIYTPSRTRDHFKAKKQPREQQVQMSHHPNEHHHVVQEAKNCQGVVQQYDTYSPFVRHYDTGYASNTTTTLHHPLPPILHHHYQSRHHHHYKCLPTRCNNSAREASQHSVYTMETDSSHCYTDSENGGGGCFHF